MHTIEIPEIKFKAEIASEVSELRPLQYQKFVKLLLELEQEKMTYEDFRVRLFVMLLDIRASRKLLNPDQIFYINAELFRLSEIMDSFCVKKQEFGRNQLVMKMDFLNNLVPQIGRLYGPDDALANISFHEYIDAHHAYLNYLNYGNLDIYLNELVTILYRPKKRFLWIRKRLASWDGQERQPYNPNNLNDRRNTVVKMPFYLKYAVFLWFQNCEEHLRTGSIDIGGSEIKFSLLYEGVSKTTGDDTGLVGVLYTLAESGVFGTVKQTAESNLYDVFVRLYQLFRSLKEAEKNNKA